MTTPAEPAPSRKALFPSWKRLAVLVLVAVLLFHVLLVGAVMIGEEKFIFLPTRYPDGAWDLPTGGAYSVEEAYFHASDGVRLHAWFYRSPGATGTVLYLHGNAGNLTYFTPVMEALADVPLDVCAVDYRGYGRSEGTPDETGVYQDADAAWRWLTTEKKIPPDRIFIHGFSLGGAVAAELASRVPCGALILESTFTSIPDVAGRKFPWLPMRWLMRTRMDTLSRIPGIRAPKLFLHSRDDEVFPFSMSERLHALAPDPKRLIPFEKSGHNDLVADQRDRYIDAIRGFVNDVIPGTKQP